MKQNNDVYEYVQLRDNKDTLSYVLNQISLNYFLSRVKYLIDNFFEFCKDDRRVIISNANCDKLKKIITKVANGTGHFEVKGLGKGCDLIHYNVPCMRQHSKESLLINDLEYSGQILLASGGVNIKDSEIFLNRV